MTPSWWVVFVVSTLATWRVTTFLCYEDGPLGIGVRLRRATARLSTELVTCFDCLAVWVALVVGVLCFDVSSRLPLEILAVAGATSLLDRWVQSDGVLDGPGRES